MEKKGFTMVELLATILIIGIVSGIGIVSVMNLRDNQREKFNKSQQQMFLETARTYFSENKQYLPQKPLGIEYVTLKELMESNYITEEFVDYDKQPFNNDSKVTVQRIGNGNYAYNCILITADGTVIESEQAKLKVSFTYENLKGNLRKLGDNHYTNSSPIVTVNVRTTNSVKIGAYEYKIYQGGRELKQSEVKYLKKGGEASKEIKIQLNVEEYTDNNYKIKIIFHDMNAHEISKSTETIVIDRIAPTKPTLENKYENKWINKGYTITGRTEDKISGIEKWQYKDTTGTYKDYDDSAKKVFTTPKFSKEQNEKVYVRACDNAGNCSEAATSMIKIDLTPPEDPTLTNPYENKWINKSYSIDGKSVDKLSGIANWEYSYTPSKGYTKYEKSASITFKTPNIEGEMEKTIYIRACDYAGNCSKYATSNIKIDKTKPNCLVSGGSNTWINATSKTSYRTITAKCEDTGSVKSECVTEPFSQKYSTDMNISTAGALGNNKGGTVKDKAGNERDCPANQIVKIDKKIPTVSLNVSSQKSNYNTAMANLSATASDTGGSGLASYCKSKTNNVNSCSWISNSSANISTTLAASNSLDGSTNTIYVWVKDNAGNVSKVSSKGYNVYKDCSNPIDNGSFSCGSYGTCSNVCGGGTKYATKTQPRKDAKTGNACQSVVTANGCPQSCGGATGWQLTSAPGFGACSVTCGGGTQSRTLGYTSYSTEPGYTSTVCNTTSVVESQACNTQSCCTGPTTTYSSWSGCSASVGVGSKSRTVTTTQCDGSQSSYVDSKRCTSRSGAKDTCYVGNTIYNTNVHWPYKTYDGIRDCTKETKGYWIYCTIDGKLWTHLNKNSKVSPDPQWACPGITIKDGYATINGKKYKQINDSGNFWQDCSNSCYHGTCK